MSDNNSNDATRLQPSRKPTPLSPDDPTRLQQRPHRAEAHGHMVQVGDTLNARFEIQALLGHGGMSAVYRAIDRRRVEAQDKNPYVAVKVLGAEFLEHPKGFVALQREAQKSQALAHPNIITVYDFDRDGNTVFMTMEELKGLPLDKVIRNNPSGVEVGEAVRMIAEIANGLAYAHSKGIVHSDLKPGNIYLCDDRSVKILDFGIARAASVIDESSGSDHTVFDAGELGGLTPAYASLEMFEHQEPHPSDDIYALGLIAFELLTGHHPFQRATAQQARQQALPIPRLKMKGLSRRQASALRSAIALERGARSENATVFRKQFSTASPMFWLVPTLLLVVLGLGALLLVQSGSTEGPAIPFAQLPPAQQEKINQAITDAQRALEFGDLNGAIFHYNTAFQLHPGNRRVEQGLNTLVDRILTTARQTAAEAPAETREQIAILLAYESLASNKKLLAFAASLAEKN